MRWGSCCCLTVPPRCADPAQFSGLGFWHCQAIVEGLGGHLLTCSASSTSASMWSRVLGTGGRPSASGAGGTGSDSPRGPQGERHTESGFLSVLSSGPGPGLWGRGLFCLTPQEETEAGAAGPGRPRPQRGWQVETGAGCGSDPGSGCQPGHLLWASLWVKTTPAQEAEETDEAAASRRLQSCPLQRCRGVGWLQAQVRVLPRALTAVWASSSPRSLCCHHSPSCPPSSVPFLFSFLFLKINLFIYLFIFGCIGSSLLCFIAVASLVAEHGL